MYIPVLGQVSDLLLAVFVLLFAFYLHCQSITGVWEKLGVPGPRPLPFLYHMKDLKHGLGPALEKWEKQYGRTFGVYNIQTRSATLVTTDAEIINNILVTDFCSFADREYLRTTASTVIDGLFFLNGSTWRRNRRVMSPMFTGAKLRLMLGHVHESASKFVEFIDKTKNKELIPVKQLSEKYASEVIAKTGFGVDADVLTKEDNKFFYHIEHFFSMEKPLWILCFLLAFYFPWIATLGYKLSSRADPIHPAAENYFVGLAKSVMAEKKREKLKDPHATSKRHTDMMDLLLEAEARGDRELTSEDNALSEKDIIGNSTVLILAGFETTSTLLQYLFYVLARHPGVQDKVIEEIDQVLASQSLPDCDSLKQLKYTEQVINETLRMFPPIPTTTRSCSSTVTYGDITIPKGSNVYIPIYRINRDPKYWPDPNTFDPERFSPTNKNSFPPAAFIPFGFGPRQCVAKRLAFMEVKSALCHVLGKMRFVLNETTVPKAGEDVKLNLLFGSLLQVPEKPIQLAVEYRKK